MTSRAKWSLVAAVAILTFSLSGTAQAATPDTPSNDGTSLLAAAWQWIVTVVAPSAPSAGPAPTTVAPVLPKAGCEMDPNGVVPSDPANGQALHHQ